ncbi:MAG: glycine betaine ABC transporter substrate-binding protein, partial [Myxococcota bacterium]
MSARDLIRRFVLFVAAVVTLASGCGEDGIRIGAKPFVEQEILAEVLQGLLEEQGIATRPTYRCDDTFDCQRALGSGHVDLMVEYTGTAFNLLGEVPPDEGQLERLDTLFEPLGVRWLSPLGFDNGYVWLVPSRRAETDGLRAMTDLAKVSSLRVAVPPEFLQRPRDGLAATAARYGMHLAAEPIVALDPAERLQAVVTGRADVVVAYETDPSAGELGLVPLADDLGFLPRYQATVVARSEALKRQPELGPALASLGGAIDAAQMRAMNQAVAVEGASRTATAHALLQARGIVDTTSERAANRTRLRIAVDDAVLRESFGPRVLMGARSVFVDRTARLETIRGKAADAVANGRARFGIVGVESFFVRDGAGRLTRRRDLQAVAALGQRVLHLLSRSDADPWAGT